MPFTRIETGLSKNPQLYNMDYDIGQQNNIGLGLCRSGGEDGKASAGDPDKREHQIKVKKVTVRVLNSL